MTAPSDGDLRRNHLANQAVPHMSQSPVTTPIDTENGIGHVGYPVVEQHQRKSHGPAEDAVWRARPLPLPAMSELFDQACGYAVGKPGPANAERLLAMA